VTDPVTDPASGPAAEPGKRKAGRSKAGRRRPAAGRRSAARKAAPAKTKPVTLALQGGGAHGAFTWGVLDGLLQDARLEIVGISGTSAGAMNGAMVVCGLAKGGPEAARAQLARFWHRVSELARFGPLQPSWVDQLAGPGGLEFSPGYYFFDVMSRVFSPYQVNFFDFHPLREVLEETCDFDCLGSPESVPLFVSATNVRSGKIKIFQPEELTVEALLASSCVPEIYKAVEIDGEHYWDGGYMGNPAIYPLLYGCAADDVILVQINPISTAKVPTTARDILDRINEISFNSSLMREMRTIAFITRLIEEGAVDHKAGLRKYHMHMIEAEQVMSQLGFSSKLNASREFVVWLRDLGRIRAEAWLERNFDKIGSESSVDIDEMFL